MDFSLDGERIAFSTTAPVPRWSGRGSDAARRRMRSELAADSEFDAGVEEGAAGGAVPVDGGFGARRAAREQPHVADSVHADCGDRGPGAERPAPAGPAGEVHERRRSGPAVGEIAQHLPHDVPVVPVDRQRTTDLPRIRLPFKDIPPLFSFLLLLLVGVVVI